MHKKIEISKRIVILFGVIIYFPILFSYFQQDEWNLFGRLYAMNSNHLVNAVSFFSLSGGHYVPFTELFSYLLFAIFHITYLPYAVVSIVGHGIVLALLYVFFQRFTKSKSISAISILFFAFNSSISQGISWVVASINTQGATIFALVSLILYMGYTEKRQSKLLLATYVFLLVSLLFKEISLGLLFIYPVTFWLKKQEIDRKTIYSSLAFGVVYFVVRLLGGGSEIASGAGGGSGVVFLYNLVSFPSKGLLDNLLPLSIVNMFALRSLVFVEALGLLAFTFILYFFFKRYSWRNYAYITWGFVFVLFNAPIYALSPERSGIITTLDSRNLYFLGIGTSLFLGSVAGWLLQKRALYVFMLVYVLTNVFFIERSLFNSVKEGLVRKSIVAQITKDYPDIPNTTVFYFESNKTYYGLSTQKRVLPFQSGFGQTLLVNYENREHFSSEFLVDNYLWAIDSQGYKKVGERGFGYYYDFDLMARYIKESGLSANNVIAYSWDGATNDLVNITEQVRGRMVGYLSNSTKVPNTSLIIKTNANNKYIENVVDGNFDSSWNSSVVYSTPQYFQVMFDKEYTLSGVEIVSASNGDQNLVGYSVYAKVDKVWKVVFSSKLTPPSQDGIVKLFFEPTETSQLVLLQTGSHDFASWVVDEIIFYETNK